MMTLASFEDMLLTVSGSAMNGCFFLGELPAWLAETEIGIKVSLLISSVFQCLNCFSLSKKKCTTCFLFCSVD